MGESKKDALRVNFDRKLKLEFHGVKVTSDAGLLACREIDDAFRLTDKRLVIAYDAGKVGQDRSHARYVTFQMAEVLVSKSLFYEILERIKRLKPIPVGYG